MLLDAEIAGFGFAAESATQLRRQGVHGGCRVSEQDPDLNALEARFHLKMLDTYDLLRRKHHYNASYFLQMALEYGEVETARRLLWKEDVSDGFTTLWELKQLDLSVEAFVLRPEYAALFPEQERGIARARLLGGVRIPGLTTPGPRRGRAWG
jgi:hypothetical protein